MLIPQNERSPRYYGATARNFGYTTKVNPYPALDWQRKEDPRYAQWNIGHHIGEIERKSLKPKGGLNGTA